MSAAATTATGSKQPEMLYFVDHCKTAKIALTTHAKVRDVFAYMDRELLRTTHPKEPLYHLRLNFVSDPEQRCLSTYNWQYVSRIKDVGPTEPLSLKESETFLSLPAATFTKDGQGVIAWMSYDKLPQRVKRSQDIKAN